jgi:hypothetical protein
VAAQANIKTEHGVPSPWGEHFYKGCAAEVKNHDLDLRLVMGRHPELMPELLQEEDQPRAKQPSAH